MLDGVSSISGSSVGLFKPGLVQLANIAMTIITASASESNFFIAILLFPFIRTMQVCNAVILSI